MEALKILQRINGIIFITAMTASVCILIYLGIQYFTAKENTEKTRKFLMCVIVGLVLLIVAGTIPTLIISFLKGRV